MPNSRRTFLKGRMQKDLDERLVPDGEYIDALNVIISNSEGSDVGAIQNSYSNKKLTNVDFGTNPLCIGAYTDEYQDKIYWFVVSDSGCYLAEWNNTKQTVSIVLEDTRPLESRVLNLKKDFLITAINKVVSEDISKDLLLWTDDNIEPCCINIERAKSYGANNFEQEDIYLIKQPPTNALEISQTFNSLNLKTNYIEEQFFSFSYRYKYLDGEYSALSTFTNYQFTPKDFKLNYITLDNDGMINSFNAIKIVFNTGGKRVTDIELVVKKSNSTSLFLIETFNKEKLGFNNNDFANYIFSNNKVYRVLPEKELLRNFDNVPLKAKSQAIIGNRIVYGNYLEGRDLKNLSGNDIFLDYGVSLVSSPFNIGSSFLKIFPNVNKCIFYNTIIQMPLKKNNAIRFNISFDLSVILNSYTNSFVFVLGQDYANMNNMFASAEFADFVQVIKNDFLASYVFEVPVGYVKFTEPNFTMQLVGANYVFSVTPLVLQKTIDSTFLNKDFYFRQSNTNLTLSNKSSSATVKTNRGYEFGLVYLDHYNRATTVLTSVDNNIFVPQIRSTEINSFRININSTPPFFAERYKIVVKSAPLRYQTVYVTNFYPDAENFVTWCQLQGSNKDKIKEGDYLIIKKSGSSAVQEVIKTKVLEIKSQPKNFISGNAILTTEEVEGLYFKIRPDNFSMDKKNYKIYSDAAGASSYQTFPIVALNMFPGVNYTTVPIPVGSVFRIWINSKYDYSSSGWSSRVFEKPFTAQRDYIHIKEFLDEVFIGKNMFANVPDGGNYKNNVSFQIVGGQLFLVILGLESAGNNGNKGGFVDANYSLRTNNDFYVFETEPIQEDNFIFYETAQTFDIIDGFHQGSNSQHQTELTPAIIDLDFFNCYAQGNGIESYIVKDSFNKNYLNIDSRPSAVSLDKYKAIRRYADLTYGEPFIESAGVNGLNEFNLSTSNFKELDKQYGSIQKIVSRDNDIAVFQEEKTSLVLYGKDVLNNADGTINVTVIKDVLGQNIMYMGENGIGKNPESIAINDKRIYYLNPTRGIAQRLSTDGVEDISEGMQDWFRDKFIANPTSVKVGGFDPYFKQYAISIKTEGIEDLTLNCGQQMGKFNMSESFTYDLLLNNLAGEVAFNYDVYSGQATIIANYDSETFTQANVSGVGVLSFERVRLSSDIVTLTVVPVTQSISFNITNLCPVGEALTLTTIVLNDKSDTDKTITNRHKRGSSPYYSRNDLFNENELNRFTTELGVEGQGAFPLNNDIVKIESFKDNSNTGEFSISKLNKLGYLITPNTYTEADIPTILPLFNYLTVTESIISQNVKINSGQFTFIKTSPIDKLYMLWDYRDAFITIDTINIINCQITITYTTNAPAGTSINLRCKPNGFSYLDLTPIDPIYFYNEVIVSTGETNTHIFTVTAGALYEMDLELVDVNLLAFAKSNLMYFQNLDTCIYVPPAPLLTFLTITGLQTLSVINNVRKVKIDFNTDLVFPNTIVFSYYDISNFSLPITIAVTSGTFEVDIPHSGQGIIEYGEIQWLLNISKQNVFSQTVNVLINF